MRPILDEWICEQAKLSNLGRYQSTRDTPAPNVSRESLMRILVWRNDRSILLSKRSGRCHNRQRRALQIDNKQLVVMKMDDMDTDNMWFQQDGVTCHTPHATMDILHELFEDMIISRGSDVNWPPRCDLMPLDFFFWDYLKSQVYTNKPQTIDALKVNIINAIQQIQPDLCETVGLRKLDPNTCTKRSRGGHLSDVTFHT